MDRATKLHIPPRGRVCTLVKGTGQTGVWRHRRGAGAGIHTRHRVASFVGNTCEDVDLQRLSVAFMFVTAGPWPRWSEDDECNVVLRRLTYLQQFSASARVHDNASQLTFAASAFSPRRRFSGRPSPS